MIDPLLGRICQPYLDRFAAKLAGRAPTFALAGFAVSLLGAALICRHFVWLGLAVFAGGVVLSALAERIQPQSLNDLYTSIRFAALPFAFALENPERAVSLIFLSFALTALMVTRLRAGSGFVGAGELLLVFVLLAIFPGGLVAYLAGVICFVSAGAAARRSA